ncbi:MAG: hypothetical protein Q9222_004856 [Ikaeria aurantiellina]
MPLHDQSVVDNQNDGDLPEAHVHEEKEYCSNPPGHHYAPPPSDRHFPTSPEAPWQPPELEAHGSQRSRPLWRRKRFYLPIAALILVAAVIGGSLGGLSARNSSSDKTPQSALTVQPVPIFITSTASNTAISATSTPSAVTVIPVPIFITSTTSNTGISAASTPTASPTAFNSSLASVAWTDVNRVGYRRLYYQDSAGVIKEAAWNSSGGTWYSSNDSLATAKPNSPIAAAVIGPRLNPLNLRLFFLDADGHLVELGSPDGSSWSKGPLTAENIVPSPTSDLAAIWTAYDGAPCNKCSWADPLLVYQDSNDKLWVVNSTTTGVQYSRLAAEPIPGSGLAMNLAWHDEGDPGMRLYYQKDADGICSADWEAWESSDGLFEWNLHEDSPLGKGSPGAPMATFSWGSDTGFDGPLLVDILSSGAQGVDLSWWTPQGWQDPQRPDVMKNVQAYSALAANADRHVYALEAGSVKEYVVSTDGLTWSFVGDVPIQN